MKITLNHKAGQVESTLTVEAEIPANSIEFVNVLVCMFSACEDHDKLAEVAAESHARAMKSELVNDKI